MSERKREFRYCRGMRGRSSESDSEYFRRRASEERRAAEGATYELAREVHAELASRYQAIADQRLDNIIPIARNAG